MKNNDQRKEWRFNTSHVTLYQKWETEFQKIFEFQYISCYSLSNAEELWGKGWSRFNTSHVTLYRAEQLKINVEGWRFNTSHVTLYLGRL